jgi:hypothetical protein
VLKKEEKVKTWLVSGGYSLNEKAARTLACPAANKPQKTK